MIKASIVRTLNANTCAFAHIGLLLFKIVRDLCGVKKMYALL